jgi:hypothetical protein
VKDAKAAEARREAMLAKHNEIIALRLMEGEEIDGDGTLVLAREPLTIFGLAEAKLCPRCCRGKRTSHLHVPTGVLTRGLPPEVVVPNAAAGGLYEDEPNLWDCEWDCDASIVARCLSDECVDNEQRRLGGQYC